MGCCGPSLVPLQYNERLKELGLMRLERRRVVSDLTETVKLIKGKYDLDRDFFSLMKVV